MKIFVFLLEQHKSWEQTKKFPITGKVNVMSSE